MSFSTNLVFYRKQAQLTQKRLSEILSISLQQVKNYECSRCLPTLDVIKRLAIAFNISSDELVFDKEEREPKNNNLKLLVSIIDTYPKDEQETVISLLDAFVKRHRLTEMSGNIG